MVWDIAAQNQRYFFLVAHDTIEKKEFDRNTNLWSSASLRKWLNSSEKGGFLAEFSPIDQKRILSADLKSVLSPALVQYKTVGSQPLFWSALPGDTRQNYSQAYGIIMKEKVFILSVEELEQLDFDRRKTEPYWLRTPYSNKDAVRVVFPYGYTYHKKASTTTIGVVPALYLEKLH
ncbi:MAG: DUF6273 domain-containing protein [Clostridia bacterium]|nr:DUF6273 domain-containing protein [Clostridia bacterium]